MIALRPVAVEDDLVQVVVPDERRGRLVAEVPVPGIEPHPRHAAIERPGSAGHAIAVGARNAEHVKPDPLVEIARERVAVDQGGPEIGVEYEVLSRDVSGRDRAAVGRAEAVIGPEIRRMHGDSGKVAEGAWIDLVVVEETQAGQHRPLFREVEVRLAVDLVAVKRVGDRGQLVAIEPQSADARAVRQAPVRIVGQDPAGPRDARFRNYVVVERNALGLVADGGRERIENRQRRTRKVPGPHLGGGHLDEAVGVRALGRAFVAHEVEGLVALDRPPDRSASLVVDELRFRVAAVAEVRIGLQALAVVVPERRAANIVGAALDLQVDGGSAREALFGVERTGHHIDDLDRFEGRVDARHVRQVRVVARSAIDAHVVGLFVRAVNREAHRPRRVGRHGVRVARRRESRQGLQEHLVIAA